MRHEKLLFIQQHVTTPWGWEICEHNAPFMLGIPHKVTSIQYECCSYSGFKHVSLEFSWFPFPKMESMFIAVFEKSHC